MAVTAGFFGSFDPVTSGHLAVVTNALNEGIADHVIVIAKPSRTKNFMHLLSRENADRLFEKALPDQIKSRTTVQATDVTAFLPPEGTNFLIRGIRDDSDLPCEERVIRAVYRDAQENTCKPLDVRWIYALPNTRLRVSSTYVRDMLFSEYPSYPELEHYLPETTYQILVDVRREIRPNPHVPETLHTFNSILTQKLG